MAIFRGFSHWLLAAVLFGLVAVSAARAQNIQFPRAPSGNGAIFTPSPTPTTPGGFGAPQASPFARPAVPFSASPNPPFNGAPASGNPFSSSPFSASPSATLSPPTTFDPYSTAPGAVNPWSPYASGQPIAPLGSGAPLNTPFGSPPLGGAPATGPLGASPQPYYGSPYGSPYGAAGTQPPNSLFPNGLWSSNPGAQPYDYTETLRFIYGANFSNTYLYKGSANEDLGINDSEVSVTAAIPNFLFSQQPVFISPGFVISLWDGPKNLPADLPGSAYAGYIDAQWATDPALQIGLETDVRVGVYTDFNTLNTNSLRIQGIGAGRFQLTPALAAKIGATYLDRNRIKLLPVVGVVWQPSQQIRFDIVFPRPKLAQYLQTVGNYEVWWYVAAEYGGGAWTIQRANGNKDRIDINDIRTYIGVETIGKRQIGGFAEIGYVFNRQVYYVVTPNESINPQNTFMARAGLTY